MRNGLCLLVCLDMLLDNERCVAPIGNHLHRFIDSMHPTNDALFEPDNT